MGLVNGVQYDAQTWWLITTAAGLVIAVIGFFLKRTMSKVDEHDRDINIIKQTYVTKDEFKDLRNEIKAELSKISDDMDEIKEKSLSRQDFYRAQADTNDQIRRVYDLLIKRSGGDCK